MVRKTLKKKKTCTSTNVENDAFIGWEYIWEIRKAQSKGVGKGEVVRKCID